MLKPSAISIASVLALATSAACLASGSENSPPPPPSETPDAADDAVAIVIQSNRNHLCVRVEATDGGPVTQGACDAGATTFTVHDLGDGRSRYEAAGTGLCLQMKDGNVDNEGLAAMGACSPTEKSQQFSLVDDSDLKRLVNVKSQKCLDIPHWRDEIGAPLGQWSCEPNENQAFRFLDALPGGPTRTMKFNPGWGIRPNTLVYASTEESRHHNYATVCDDPNISLFVLTVPWGTMETAQDVYDFSQIDSDLAVARSCGKKIIIEPWYQKYGNHDRTDTRFFPQYIIDAGAVTGLSNGETHVRIDQPYANERFYRLYEALAGRYDTDPDVEQIVVTETASVSSIDVDGNVESTAFVADFVTRVQALFPHTAVIIYANWMDNPEQARDLLAAIAPLGSGVGAPDIIGPPGMGYEDMGSKALRGVGLSSYYGPLEPGPSDAVGDYGTVDYRGQIVVSYQYQGLGDIAAERIIEYALTELRATHLIFDMISYGDGAQWVRTKATIDANVDRLNRTRPSLLH